MIISKKIPLVCVSLVSLLLAACDAADTPAAKSPVIATHLVAVISAVPRPVSHQQLLSGTLEAEISVRLHNEEAGLITQIPFHEGDVVKQGELLVAFDSDMIRAELDKATALRQQAEIDYQRVKKLLPQKLTSEEEVARSLTTLNIAIAEQQLQQLRMARTRIKAPFDGVISQRLHEPGDAVDSHSHLLSMIQPDRLLVKVNVSDQWLTLLKKGDAMSLTIDALGDQKHAAYVERIHPEIAASTRKGTIELSLRPVPAQARAGQMARIHFQSPPVELLVVPTHAIHHDINGAYVYLVVSDAGNQTSIRHRYLSKGRQFGDWTEIIAGIESGDAVVSKGFLGLRDGKIVTVVTAAEPAANNVAP